MASVREYAYYWDGNQLAIVERDTTFDNDVNSKDYGPGSDRSRWLSPKASVADGLEVRYTYAPTYTIDETEDKDVLLDTYISLDGLLKIQDTGSHDYSGSPASLVDGSYILLEKAGKFNGLHKVKAAGAGYITLYTKYSGSGTLAVSFQEVPDLYYNISVLIDESFNIPLQPYLNKALVYYVKAKYLEDMGDLEKREYFMSKFYKQIEKYNNSKVTGIRIISPGPLAIR
tara:strand:+ start:47 stop:733 length:687 start_codon:yes stop_codon:yes gene_type:complete